MKTTVTTREMAAHLTWTSTGQVWAHWRLTGQPYAMATSEVKEGVRAVHQALIRALPGDCLLLGVRAETDPASVVSQMMDGVDLGACPQWVAECEATWDSLSELRLGRRIYWLSVPLATSGLTWVKDTAHAKLRDLRDALGLPRTQISREEILARADQARRIAEAIPAVLAPTPATPAQMLWLHAHHLRRGMLTEDLPEAGEPVTEALAGAVVGQGWRRGTALAEPLLDEGGTSDLTTRAGRLTLPRRKFVKVSDSTAPDPDTTTTYQSLLVVSDTPDGGAVFPGGEMLGRVDETGLHVDWALRLRVLSSAQTARLNRAAQRKVNDQYWQRSTDGLGMNAMDRVMAELAEYVELMEGDSLEVETQASLVFAVSAPDPDTVRARATALAGWLSHAGYKSAQPLGYQTDLWWAMHPGVPTSPVVAQYAQIAPSRDLACLVPLVSPDVGDRQGILLGLNITNGPLTGPGQTAGSTGVVFYDPEGASDLQVSGSIAFAGALGAGKTTALMTIAGAILDRGGDLIITDKTDVGEWARWASGLTTVAVIDPAQPTVSIDPLRMFGVPAGEPILRNFLVALAGLDRASQARLALAEIVNVDYLQAHDLTTTAALLEHLRSGDCTRPGAQDLLRVLQVYAARPDGRVIFDDQIPVVAQGHHRALVFRTHGMRLPSEDDLRQSHLFGQLSDDKVLGRAFHALIAGIARKVCFADSSRLSGFIVSEARAMTASPEAAAELTDMVAEGRKYRAVVALDCHDPWLAFRDETMKALMPYRVIMRTGDEDLARRCLAWAGADPDDPENLDRVMALSPRLSADSSVPDHRAGEGVIRDAHGRLAVLKILLPSNPDRAAVLRRAGSASTRLTKTTGTQETS